MKNTTLCYIEEDNKYLMLLRNKKENDENSGKWIGVGGHFEEGESPEECLCREVLEETGLTLIKYKLRGIITFVSSEWGTEYMHLFSSNKYEGKLIDCEEGDLKWISKEDVFKLNLWEGDRIFLEKLINTNEFISLKLIYEGDKLVKVEDYSQE